MLLRILGLIFLTSITVWPQTPTIEPGVSRYLSNWRAKHYNDVRYKLDLRLEKMSPVLKGTIEIHVNAFGDQVIPGKMGLQYFWVPAIVLDWRSMPGYENYSTINNVTINGTKLQKGTVDELRRDDSDIKKYFEYDGHLIFIYGVTTIDNVIKLDFTSPILTGGSAVTRYVDKEDGSEYVYGPFDSANVNTAFPVFDQPDLKAKFELSLFKGGRRGYPRWTTITNSEASLDFESTWAGFASFDETEPISGSAFAFAFGHFQGFNESGYSTELTHFLPIRESWKLVNSDPDQSEPALLKSEEGLKIFVRKSLAPKFKLHAAEVFRLTREAMKFLETHFNKKFPWQKYDLVLIPEFSGGVADKAGVTFLRESSVILPTEPTSKDLVSRALLIFHATARQWAGEKIAWEQFDRQWLTEVLPDPEAGHRGTRPAARALCE